ncbi:hypothetical protein [Cohaesibacter marisflavi]|nr:hypothetical protein [Cohaesibacter marisflavi]
MGASLAPTMGEAAFAQEIEDVDDDAIYHLERIVVAATKRVENAFDVVADIAVANSEELQEQDITSVDELDTIFSDLHIRRLCCKNSEEQSRGSARLPLRP